MTRLIGHDIMHRWEGNPLISLEGLGFRCSDVHNAGIIRLEEEHYLALVTIETLQGRRQVHPAYSRDGLHFDVEKEPLLAPGKQPGQEMYNDLGVGDSRITRFGDKYFIIYQIEGVHGIRVALASTTDFQTLEHYPIATQVDVKSAALFPEKINGKYALLKRPASGAIWISYSHDLEFWGEDKCVMTPCGGFWDPSRIGTAAVPIRVDGDWLLIYYGIKDTSAGPLCRLGAAVLDGNDPSKVIARSHVPLLSPREKYERIGDVPNTVFSCGALVEDDELRIYYGASESCICLGITSLKTVMDLCDAWGLYDEAIRGQ